ncbi:MAG: (d)CMP kinase [Candidatus Omnitrophota bacterium]|nr:(d)CMP kinase [Candidatus Omnitrophota bacterium]
MAAKRLTITLDGPAGAGKSTAAQALAKRLGISYLDTGAMYRALTLKGLRAGIDLADENALAALAKRTRIDFKEMPDGTLNVTLDGVDVSRQIRTIQVTNNTFYAARAPKVRKILVARQRQIGLKRSLVGDGRDLGTVVFPKADYKFYLDADFEERVQRRLRDLKVAHKTVDKAQLRADMKERDHKDLSRTIGPLKKAKDAIVIDSSGLTVETTVDKIMRHISR